MVNDNLDTLVRDNKYSPTFYLHLICNYVLRPFALEDRIGLEVEEEEKVKNVQLPVNL